MAGRDLPDYVDSSVLIAMLAPDDPRHAAAGRWLNARQGRLLTSAIAEVEVGRALGRRHAPRAVLTAARDLLAGCDLVEVSSDIRIGAIAVKPGSVRSLDALHVATAVVAGLERFATYDDRQRLAAEEAGLTTLVP
jgi:predicted nucleic acid-binding protein